VCLVAGRQDSSRGAVTDTELPRDMGAWAGASGTNCLGHRLSLEAEGDE
jgi:hypothetical protein